jgi:hypothetical protein
MLSPIQIITGILSALIVAAILYCFRMRQLYLVVSRLFQYSKLNQSAKTMELIIINRGRQTEEEIIIEFDPAHTYKIIALTSPDIILEDSMLQIKRIPPRDEVSVILETTDSNFSKKNVAKISSKTSKGKILEKVEEVPPNAGNSALLIGFFILALLISWLSIDSYFKYKMTKETNIVNDISHATGWTNLNSYAESSLAGLYLNGKFPVEIKEYKRVKDKIILEFELINNAEDWINFDVKVVSPTGNNDYDNSYKPWIHDVMVAPKTTLKQTLSAYLPAKYSHKILFINVNIKYKEHFFVNIEKQIKIDQ